jgi:hypothetical protein
MKIPVTNGSGSKWIPIVLQTLLILGAFFVYAMREEGRLSSVEQGQADLKQQVVELDRRLNTYLDKH